MGTSLQVGEWKIVKTKVSSGRVVEVSEEVGGVLSPLKDGAGRPLTVPFVC